MPKISVVMPVYNSERYLREAIDSILAQTFSDFEFIIIDDGSQDSSPDIVRSYTDKRIRFYQNEHNMGVAATLNRGLDLASGEYIARMDSDDISLPERFEKQIRFLDCHPDYGICGSCIIVFSESNSTHIVNYAETDLQIRADMFFNSAFAHPSVMLRRKSLGASRYDCAYEKAEDYELWYRLLQHTKGYNLQSPLLRYRHHATQVTQTQKNEQHKSVLKLHQTIISNKNIVLSQDEYAVFLKICSGVRTLSPQEYESFFFGGQKIIASADLEKTNLTKLYSSLNRVVKTNSNMRNNLFFYWDEPICNLLSKIKRILR